MGGSYTSNIDWFDDDVYIGSEITFQEPQPSKWKIERKISSHDYFEGEADVKNLGLESEGRAGKPSSSKAKQAKDTMSAMAEMEIEALEILTKAGCSCTPTLFAWKQDKQKGPDAWVPGGYIVYILMEKLPGITVDNFYFDLGREERDVLRGYFKVAWLYVLSSIKLFIQMSSLQQIPIIRECMKCGVINSDRAIRNLLWDKENKKCYIIDFEIWQRPTEKHAWCDGLYIAWNLAMVCGGNSADMSTWEL
ncbi:hypothetical protein F5884DRAFT_855005 [Xylogone sp. PMI_703]|nr:hypothetical protein F5884DRAFT_855005 [Xylogone sp. PMI_703]